MASEPARSGRPRAVAHAARVELREAAAMRTLPPRVALFVWRARMRARRTGDTFALDSSLPPADLARLLSLARGRTRVAELGTAHGWTAAALALADPARRVTTLDPVVRAPREGYLALAGRPARARVECVQAAGARAPRPVDLLYIDSSHEREETLAEVRAWRPQMPSGAVIVFDDYVSEHYPGVAQAIHELGLSGDPQGRLFVHRLP